MCGKVLFVYADCCYLFEQSYLYNSVQQRAFDFPPSLPWQPFPRCQVHQRFLLPDQDQAHFQPRRFEVKTEFIFFYILYSILLETYSCKYWFEFKMKTTEQISFYLSILWAFSLKWTALVILEWWYADVIRGVSLSDIHEGKGILGILWIIILRFAINDVSEEGLLLVILVNPNILHT